MRFAAVPLPQTEPQRSPAVEFVQRLIAGDKLPLPSPEAKPAEPPVDLDQRVRLLGEW
jgi:hypothetical protein